MKLRKAVRTCLLRLRGLAADDGIAITEYGLLVALIVLAMIAVLGIFGGQISSWFASRTATITTV